MHRTCLREYSECQLSMWLTFKKRALITINTENTNSKKLEEFFPFTFFWTIEIY